jgi:hypothetical protein
MLNTKNVVVLGGWLLAFGAAFANTGLVLHTGTSISHLTVYNSVAVAGAGYVLGGLGWSLWKRWPGRA